MAEPVMEIKVLTTDLVKLADEDVVAALKEGQNIQRKTVPIMANMSE